MEKQIEEVVKVPTNYGHATVSKVDSIYRLMVRYDWDDAPAEEWAEYYPTFPMAMLRLAVYLQSQEEVTYGNLFRHDGLVFANYADTFFRMELRD
jgi:hypothetical protein